MNSQLINFKIIAKAEIGDILEQCRGNNQKGIFLMYSKEELEQVPFLSKILAAVQLDLATDVLVLAAKSAPRFSLSDLKQHQTFDKVIIFGFSPSQLGLQLQLQPYQLYTISNTQYLFTDSLETIAASTSLKGQLWKALQLLFVNKED